MHFAFLAGTDTYITGQSRTVAAGACRSFNFSDGEEAPAGGITKVVVTVCTLFSCVSNEDRRPGTANASRVDMDSHPLMSITVGVTWNNRSVGLQGEVCTIGGGDWDGGIAYFLFYAGDTHVTFQYRTVEDNQCRSFNFTDGEEAPAGGVTKVVVSVESNNGGDVFTTREYRP